NGVDEWLFVEPSPHGYFKKALTFQIRNPQPLSYVKNRCCVLFCAQLVVVPADNAQDLVFYWGQVVPQHPLLLAKRIHLAIHITVALLGVVLQEIPIWEHPGVRIIPSGRDVLQKHVLIAVRTPQMYVTNAPQPALGCIHMLTHY